MALDQKVRENWEKLQAQYDYPVDATGRPIETSDQQTLNVWKAEGVDRFLKR
jgi:hypothetical protein